MSTVEKISQLSHRIFNTSLNENRVARQSNPFAASNFQKNILTEDVFESSKAKDKKQVNFTGNLSTGSKRIYSMFVGSISDFGSKISECIESAAKFGARMKNGIVNTWHTISEVANKDYKDALKTEVHLGVISDMYDGAKNLLNTDVTNLIGNSKNREITKLAKMNPTSEVKPMLKDALSALEQDLVMVA